MNSTVISSVYMGGWIKVYLGRRVIVFERIVNLGESWVISNKIHYSKDEREEKKIEAHTYTEVPNKYVTV